MHAKSNYFDNQTLGLNRSERSQRCLNTKCPQCIQRTLQNKYIRYHLNDVQISNWL